MQRRSTKQLYVTKTVKKKYISAWCPDQRGEEVALPMEVANLLVLDHPNIGMYFLCCLLFHLSIINLSN